MEQVSIQLFKLSTSNGGIVEIDYFIEGIDLNIGLDARRKGSLSLFTCSTQTADSSLVLADVFVVFGLELSNKMDYHSVVRVFST